LEKTTTVKTVAIDTNQTISGLNVAPLLGNAWDCSNLWLSKNRPSL